MEKVDVTLAKIIELAMQYTGAQPTFKLNSKKTEVLLVDASSGFLKLLMDDPKALLSLHDGTISVMYFK